MLARRLLASRPRRAEAAPPATGYYAGGNYNLFRTAVDAEGNLRFKRILPAGGYLDPLRYRAITYADSSEMALMTRTTLRDPQVQKYQLPLDMDDAAAGITDSVEQPSGFAGSATLVPLKDRILRVTGAETFSQFDWEGGALPSVALPGFTASNTPEGSGNEGGPPMSGNGSVAVFFRGGYRRSGKPVSKVSGNDPALSDAFHSGFYPAVREWEDLRRAPFAMFSPSSGSVVELDGLLDHPAFQAPVSTGPDVYYDCLRIGDGGLYNPYYGRMNGRGRSFVFVDFSHQVIRWDGTSFLADDGEWRATLSLACSYGTACFAVTNGAPVLHKVFARRRFTLPPADYLAYESGGVRELPIPEMDIDGESFPGWGRSTDISEQYWRSGRVYGNHFYVCTSDGDIFRCPVDGPGGFQFLVHGYRVLAAPREGYILVATDPTSHTSGIICSQNDGQTWRSVPVSTDPELGDTWSPLIDSSGSLIPI